VNRLFDALGGAADGAFVVDDELRIVFWNEAAKTILGFDSNDVVGKFCYQILRGHDNVRHLVCSAQCKVAELSLNSKPVPNYDIQMATKHDVSRWLNMSIFSYEVDDTEGKKVVVHFFRDSNKKFDEKSLSQLVEAIRRYQDDLSDVNAEGKHQMEVLTPREAEILTLLAKGHGSNEIAELLSISLNTVRNHIQNILQKFQVHTRLEAVAYAIKNDLINY